MRSQSRPVLWLAMASAIGACGGDDGRGRDVVEADGGDGTADGADGDDVARDSGADGDDGEDVALDSDGADGDVGHDVALDSGDDGHDGALDSDGADGDVVVGPVCGDGVAQGDEACDDGDLDDLDGCDRRCALTVVVPPPAVGEVIIDELMVSPTTPDPRGEWVELASIATANVNLSGCALADDGTDWVPFATEDSGAVELAPGALFLAASEGGAAAPQAGLVYHTMLLDDAADEVVLVCDGEEIDRVAWVPFAWPIVSGRALSLDPSRVDALANDAVGSWCAATAGTPGAVNPSCPQLDRAVDGCRLLAEASVRGFADAAVGFDVEVVEPGLTDLTPGVDASPELVIEVGVGTADADLGEPAAFAWSRALPKEGWEAPVGNAAADVWRGEVSAGVGGHAVLGRASRDGGASWTYCDRDGGALDAAVALTLVTSPCAHAACDAPPAATCAADGVHVDGFLEEGVCTPVDDDDFACAYVAERGDCGALGRVCADASGGAACGGVPPTPVAGELWFSELMLRPTATAGQWVELRSASDAPRLLTGCTLTTQDGGAEQARTWTIEAPTVIGAHGAVVIGASELFEDNGGAAVDRAWGADFGPLATTGMLAIACGDELDRVAWDTSWPGLDGGASASLSPLRRGSAANDAREGWCRATASYGVGDRGTPGGDNPNCPGDVVPVEACRLGGSGVQSPPAGTHASVPVQVVARTWTAKTLKTDVNAKLLVEVGYAARGAGPTGIGAWFPSVADTTWSASGGGVDPAEDRYLGDLAVPAVGSWDLFARATADGGNTWVVCDASGIGSAAPLALSPTPSACSPDPCGAAPVPYCKPVASGSPVEVVSSEGPAVCRLEGNAARCAWRESVTADCSDDGAQCGLDPLMAGAGATCVGFPRTPEAGEMALSELLIAAGGAASGVSGGVSGDQELGEWIELQNLTDDALELSDCGLRSAPGEAWDFGEPLTPLGYVVAPGEAVTVARGTAAGVAPIMLWRGLALDNVADEVALVCAGVEIDRVAWDARWPIVSGQAMQLSGAFMDATADDDAARWCSPGSASPNATNLVCPADRVVDDCRVVASVAAVAADVGFEAAVLVEDVGVTDLRHGPDAAIDMRVELGLGPADEAPLSSFAWRWSAAVADDAWDDRASGPAGWDRWRAEVAAHATGGLRLLGRVSLDGGATWALCGTGGLAEDATEGKAMTIAAGVCTPNPCTTPPAAFCSGATLTAFAPLGSCAVSDGAAQCSYPSESLSCAAYGGCNAVAASCTTGPARPAAVGDLVVSEVMRDSTLPAPDLGEWVEVYNATNAALDLRGCELVEGGGARTTILRAVPDIVLGGQHAVFAHSDDANVNGGIPSAFGRPRSLGAVALDNGADSLALVCGGVEIDRVAWSFGWPGATGVAMQLGRLSLDAVDNDERGAWCPAVSFYGSKGNRGTPGSLNGACF